MSTSSLYASFAKSASRWCGRPRTFALAIGIILAWLATGPLFDFSATWQLIINTGTTIVTFLMVFLIQNTQNRDNAAIQTKLDELIRASEARNRLVGIEHLTEKEVDQLRKDIERKVRARAKGGHGRLPEEGAQSRHRGETK
jgi:low affinity Fe/Cu permease